MVDKSVLEILPTKVIVLSGGVDEGGHHHEEEDQDCHHQVQEDQISVEGHQSLSAPAQAGLDVPSDLRS